MMNMECPVCGKECEDMTIISHEAEFVDVADHVFRTLIERGYAVSYDNINMILDIIHDFMMGCDDETERS
jgi:formylmethanofuran dehydrogenase subunit B